MSVLVGVDIIYGYTLIPCVYCVIMNLHSNYFYTCVFMTSDLESFIQQRHKIKGQLVEITVSEELPQLEEEDDDDTKSVQVDIIPDIIEVTGENLNNTDVLEMYFQGVKSGGGREKEVEWIRNIDDGVVHVKFISTEGMYNISLKQLNEKRALVALKLLRNFS